MDTQSCCLKHTCTRMQNCVCIKNPICGSFAKIHKNVSFSAFHVYVVCVCVWGGDCIGIATNSALTQTHSITKSPFTLFHRDRQTHGEYCSLLLEPLVHMIPFVHLHGAKTAWRMGYVPWARISSSSFY